MSSKLLNTFFNTNLINISRGKGIYLFDKSGNKYVDLTGGFTGHAILGWGNKKIVNAIKQQLNKISHIDYKYLTDSNRESLAKIILKNCNNNLNKVFLVGSSGAEACEAAVKMSFQVHYDNGKKNKNLIISRKQSYHGCTSQSLALGDRPNLNFYKGILNKNVHKINEHNFLRKKFKHENEQDYSHRSAAELEKKIIQLGPDRVGAFVAETMAGGLIGDVPPAKNYWKKVRKICSKYDIHLILDEVWCGTGVSGKYFCFDYDSITPDFVFLSKTLAAGYGALSLVITREELFKQVKKRSGQIYYSNTHQGHSLSTAAALEVQKIINNKYFLNEVNNKGHYLRDIINSELKNHDFFVNVRGRGMRNSFEYNCINKNLFGSMLKDNLKKKYNIFIDAKWHRLCFCSSILITKEEISQYLDLILKEFKTLSKKWSSKNVKNYKLAKIF
jgi:adenosylmethionine-8-amino-7-oxononanoate aminotransferase